nr:hypothetical protein [bacterium]
MKVSKHDVGISICLALMLIMATGCAGDVTHSPNASITPVVEASPSADPTPGKTINWPSNIDFTAMQGKTIKIYGGETKLESTMPQYKTLQDQFSGEYGVHISYVSISPDRSELFPSKNRHETIYRFLIATNNSPTIIPSSSSTIYKENPPVPKWAAMGIVQPIDEWLDDRDNTFLHGVCNANTWKGKRYCLQYYEGAGYPKGKGMLSVVYNLDEMKRRGMESPMESWERGEWTWDKLVELSRQLNTKRENGTYKQYGFVYDEMAIGAAIAQSGSQLCRE